MKLQRWLIKKNASESAGFLCTASQTGFEPATEIWGNNVMVFEYQVPIRQTSSALKDVAAAIEEQLNEVAYERRIAPSVRVIRLC